MKQQTQQETQQETQEEAQEEAQEEGQYEDQEEEQENEQRTVIYFGYFINLLNNLEDVKIVLNENDLNDIPLKKYSEISTEINTCSICQDELSKDNIIRQLGCSHIYHKECIDKYLLEYSNKCPICRTKITDHRKIFFV